MADFDATQAIDLSDCDDETDDEVADEDKKPVAHLKVLSHKGFPETLFPLYDGNNVVGRQEGSCNVLIPLKALSKQHACVEVRAEQHFLVDKGSRNKTRRGKMFLLPEAKYELQPGDQLMFADICCVYLREGAGNTSKVRNEAVNKAEDSGSETGSESMLLPEEEGVKAVVDETFNYEEASDPSSDLLQPTQAFPADGNGLHQPSISTSVPDSDPETDPAEPAERAQEAGEPAMVAETPAIERTKGKKITMALTETLTYYEEEEDDDEEERERMACEPTQAYDSGGETDEGEGFDDNRRSAIFEAATQVCVDCEAETQAVADPGDGFVENRRPTIFEAETQVCVDFEAETLVADPDTAENNMVDNDGMPKKVPKDEKEMSQLIFASGDLPVEDKSTNSDLDSSCDSPVFPSSLGRTEEGDGVGSSPTLNLYVGESPTLHKKIEDSEFTRPFPVVNKIPTGSEVKSRTSGQRRQQDGSPMQLPSTATSDPSVCSAQAGVADSGSVVESPEGSTGFEPKMHSTQIGGKSCHDDSFPSLHFDMSQQDACLPSNEESLSNNTDNICTQAYGRGGNVTKQGLDEGVITDETPAYGDTEGFTNYPNKGGHIAATFDDVFTQAYGGEEEAANNPNKRGRIAAKSDDVCTQAYGSEEVAANNPNKRGRIAAKSDDVCTQAYGSEEVAANNPNKRGRVAAKSDDVCTQAYGSEEVAANNPNKRGCIAANSDDVCTQAYGGEEVATNNPNKGGHIAANSDDICTQVYGSEEGAANNPNKRGHISANSDDICTQAYGGEETAVLRSSPRRRQGRKRAVLTAEVPPTSTGSDQSQVVESSQPLEDEDDDVLMPLGVGRQFNRSAVRKAEARSVSHGLGDSGEPAESLATEPSQRGRVQRRTQSQGPSEITPVATRRRCSLGTDAVSSTMRKEDNTDGLKPRKAARLSRDATGDPVMKRVGCEVTGGKTRQTRRAAGTDVEPLAETMKKPKFLVKEQKETKTRSVRNGVTKKRSAAAGQDACETRDNECTGENALVVEPKESETRSTRNRRSVIGKQSTIAAQEESEKSCGEHIKQKLSVAGKQSEINPRSTRNRRSVIGKALTTSAQEQNETSSGEHVEENLKMIGKQSEGKPRPTRSQKSVNEKQLPTDEQGENETSDGEQKEKLSEVEKQNESKPLPRMSRRSTEKRATTARSRKIVIDKSTMSVTAEQEVTKTTRCKTGVDKKPPVTEEQVKGNPRSARNRKSVVLEATQPNKSRTTAERESLASTEPELKESKTRSTSKMDNPPKLEQRESETRSIRNRKQIDVKLSTATKQKESEAKPTTCAEEMSSLATEQTESKTRSKRNRESTVEKPSTASVPERRASSRRSSLNVKVKATSDPLVPPKQKENVLVGKSPKRRQASLAPANDPDTSQPSKKSRGRQLPAVPRSSLSTSLRERHPSSRPRVMFTGMFDSHGEQILKSLGGHIVDSVYECTHLVTDRVRRTVKFLCGIGRGIPIVGPGWLLSCREANTFTDVDRFLVQDEENEKKFHFSLVTSLQKAASGGLLVGYKVHVTANVKPEPKQMKDIIQCAGGEYLSSPPCSYQEKTVVVSCDANKAVCQRTLDGNIPVVSAEFLLTGILRQEVELDQHRLVPAASMAKIVRSSRKKR